MIFQQYAIYDDLLNQMIQQKFCFLKTLLPIGVLIKKLSVLICLGMCQRQHNSLQYTLNFVISRAEITLIIYHFIYFCLITGLQILATNCQFSLFCSFPNLNIFGTSTVLNHNTGLALLLQILSKHDSCSHDIQIYSTSHT